MHTQRCPVANPTFKFLKNPETCLESMAIVLKSPDAASKGLVLLAYSYFFPLFLHIFNVPAIQKDYHICLEPSWSGFFTRDILSFTSLEEPVFVQAIEPRDALFIERGTRNLIPVSIAANYWVDYRSFSPLRGSSTRGKDVDIVMVSSWAKFKRHALVFEALKNIKRAGRELKISLVGYPIDLTKDDIWHEAKSRGIENQIEMFENLSPSEVVTQYQRAKLNLLWSKKEGFNRSIIEGMFCNIPCILREGFNYGHKYHYINRKTGQFVSEGNLETAIIHMVDNFDRFSPREYVENTMTWERAVDILHKKICAVTKRNGENFSGEIVGKINNLNGMSYWNPADSIKFSKDYEHLMTHVKI